MCSYCVWCFSTKICNGDLKKQTQIVCVCYHWGTKMRTLTCGICLFWKPWQIYQGLCLCAVANRSGEVQKPVASELSLCMFHFLSSPLLGEICGVFGAVTSVGLFVLLVWEKLLVISMGAFVSPGLLVFHRTAVWFKSISVTLNIIAKLFFLSKLSFPMQPYQLCPASTHSVDGGTRLGSYSYLLFLW